MRVLLWVLTFLTFFVITRSIGSLVLLIWKVWIICIIYLLISKHFSKFTHVSWLIMHIWPTISLIGIFGVHKSSIGTSTAKMRITHKVWILWRWLPGLSVNNRLICTYCCIVHAWHPGVIEVWEPVWVAEVVLGIISTIHVFNFFKVLVTHVVVGVVSFIIVVRYSVATVVLLHHVRHSSLPCSVWTIRIFGTSNIISILWRVHIIKLAFTTLSSLGRHHIRLIIPRIPLEKAAASLVCH